MSIWQTHVLLLQTKRCLSCKTNANLRKQTNHSKTRFFMLFHALQVNLGFVDQRRSASAFRRFIVSAKLLYVSQLLTS